LKKQKHPKSKKRKQLKMLTPQGVGGGGGLL